MMEGLTGIVVCGGRSSRMGTDKGGIRYREQPQYLHVAAMLHPSCKEVYLSVNEQQQAAYGGSAYPLLTDHGEYRNIGPMAALLIAARQLPDAHFLLIGCDYPLLEGQELGAFMCTLEPGLFAKAFYNTDAGMYEPLLAYYSARAAQQLLAQAASWGYSLQRFLKACEADRYYPMNKDSILSVDDPETAILVKEKLGTGKTGRS